MMRKLAALISILALGWIVSAQADDIADGAKLYIDKACITCHGENGSKPLIPAYPKLAGQNADYATPLYTTIRLTH
ncbi:c-type cytochrome [Thiofilum sp.]|uniref:c-type cytochrome n=1 Tax=Thiofilum sp. TaxID=2212733 RepID=UPI0025E03E41|nr:c-type cytochrome [Thiofilum sp.]